MTYLALVILFGILLLPAVAMVFIPFLPTFWYLLAIFAVLACIFGVSILVDWSAGLLGAKLGGAAWKSVAFGALGAFVGFLIVPPLGVLPGLFAGVLCGELQSRRSAPAALRAASRAPIR